MWDCGIGDRVAVERLRVGGDMSKDGRGKKRYARSHKYGGETSMAWFLVE